MEFEANDLERSGTLATSEQSLTVETCLSEVQSSAAYMLGRCMARKQIMAQLEIDSRTTFWRWLQIPEFQEAVRRSNREWLAELNAQKARIIERALELEEESLHGDSDKRYFHAHEIARNVLR